ncbi:putative ABC transporter, ATP-binding/permease protein [Pseudodesulfovibrio piezophilus C1TLV30]|uniref:Putative ABC transporter, ATP-binding/permease protein n=2 Tax=Pseudodesulfovibrio TaxID=2035811 RepID=M1WVI2_PSEP2|nr:putative ABC transporter, ATP-binding/permease protein [Pseudodesulfovibrio piezophilus C1TLV30]
MEERQSYLGQLRDLIRGLGFSDANKRRLIIACVASGIAALLGLTPSLVIAFIVDGFSTGTMAFSDSATQYTMGGIVLCALLSRLLLRTVAGGLAHTVAYETLYEIRTGLADHLATLPLGFFSSSTTGELKKMLVDDVEEFEGFIAHHLEDLSAALVMPFLVLAALVWVDYRMALATVVVVPLAIMIMSIASKDYMQETARYHSAQENLNSRIIEFVRNIHEIKAFSHTVSGLNNFMDAVREYQDVVETWAKRWALPRAGFIIAIENPILFTLPLGLWLYGRGSLSAGSLTLCVLLSMQFSPPIFKVLQQNDALLRVFEGYRRMKQVWDTAPLPVPERGEGHTAKLIAATGEGNDPQAQELTGHAFGSSTETGSKLNAGGDMVFSNVSFAYGTDGNVLHDVSFTVPHGTVTALVGFSGSGKSTLLRLVPRFWDVSSGSIQIGEKDIRSMSEPELMGQIGFMFQENILFNESLRENIRMGKLDAEDSQVEQLARQACCHDFIAAQPQGYDSVAGELGANLSGGERQRIALARTLLKDAPILLLDEATSAVDAFTEAEMNKALSGSLHGRTAIVVAHRLETIAGVDQIVVLDKGHVIDVGRHADLLHRCGMYRDLWQLSQHNSEWKPAQEVA